MEAELKVIIAFIIGQAIGLFFGWKLCKHAYSPIIEKFETFYRIKSMGHDEV